MQERHQCGRHDQGEGAVMLLSGETSIREVIAFPKNKKARDLMVNAPSKISEEQLKELHIMVIDEEEK